MFVKKGKFHEILAKIFLLLSMEVLEVGGAKGTALFVRKRKFHEIFGRNIFTIVNGNVEVGGVEVIVCQEGQVS